MSEKTRTIVGVVLIVALLAVMFLFQMRPESTDGPESAAALWEMINEKMDGLESLETTIITTKTYYQGDKMYHHSGTNYILSTKDAHYTHSKNVLSGAADETMELVEAYYDGKIYRSVNDGIRNQKLCSPMSHEEYDGRHTGTLADSIPLIGCTNSNFSEKENGWELTYSGYTKKAINAMVSALGLEGDPLGSAIEDMRVTILASKDYYVQQMQIVFVFATVEGEKTPSFTVHTEYSGFNTAVFDPAKLKPEEFVEVEDIRFLESVSAAIAQQQNATTGYFKYTLNSTQTHGEQTQSSQESGTMQYGLNEDGYFYLFNANDNGKTYVLSYSKEMQTVTSGGQTYTVAMTSKEAKAYVDSLIDSARYDPLSINNVEKLEEGVYLLTGNAPDLSDYEGYEVIEDRSGTQQIKLTFQNGIVEKIESTMTLTGVYQNNAVTITTESVIDFVEEETPSET